MKRLLIALLLVSTPLFAQTTRDVQKKASRQTANVETLSADKVLTYLDAETQLLTPSGGNRIVTLPSTNVWKAWTVTIVNEDAANTLVIKSSDGDTLDTLAAVGRVEFVAKQTAPTDTLHWVNISKIGTLGVTDGSSACVGCVGEVISANGSLATPNCLIGTPTTTASITLTAGSWIVGGSTQHDNRAGVTGGESRLFVKGVGGATYGYDLMFSTSAAAINVVPMTFSLRPVAVVAGDSDKTVLIKTNTNGAVSACYAQVYAVRIR